MGQITGKRKLPLWGIALGSLVATSLSTGAEAAETMASSPKPSFIENTLCKLCFKTPQNNTVLDNCIRNCPEVVKKNRDALIAQKEQKNESALRESNFIRGFDKGSKEKSKKDAEKRKAKLDSEIKTLNAQIDKINHGLDRVRKALDVEIQSKKGKLTATNKKHLELATKGINSSDIEKQGKETQSIKDQIKKLEERKQRINSLFFSVPSATGAPPPVPPREEEDELDRASLSFSPPPHDPANPPPPLPRDPGMETEKIIPSHSLTQPMMVTPPLPQATTAEEARPPLPPRPQGNGSSAQPSASANPSTLSAPARPSRSTLQAGNSAQQPVRPFPPLPTPSPSVSDAPLPPPLVSQPNPPPPPPLPPASNTPPPPPPPRASTPPAPASSPQGGGRDQLLNAIRQGTQLKKVDPNDPKAGLPPQKLPPKEQLSNALAGAMAARRGAMKPQKQEESDEEWSE
jgi:hypothetical protein